MDIGSANIVTQIASGTTQYLAVYSPIFLLIGGLVLGIGIIATLISILTKKPVDIFNDDDILWLRANATFIR